MRKLTLATGSFLILAAPLAQADILGLGASVSYWDSDLSGNVAKDNDAVDVDDELRLDNDGNANAGLYLEHPVPLLPNVALSHTKIQQSGRGALAHKYDRVDPGAVYSELDLEQLDLTLYYEVLDNWVNLDLGLTVRDFSGDLLVRSADSSQSSRTEADAVLPLGYISARFDLPFTGASVGGSGNFISYSGDSMRDFNVYGQYRFSVLQLRAGYRQIAVDYEDSDDVFDVKLDGPFISAGVTF
ncbi:TIGR04219 family outer membrane beta-barrel protein [Marinobacter adhaerens]|uniref:TIGR04219 family outer membrane beta-barrel protein n=1 Tax=Marinobacter adhaerens TaxID=1033846 RepID=A0A851HQX5_9GAMM|nr:TIGR04219 family outer membrane beta-barrel protein [Marinobacter adhaerens]NWN91413.1 TIGR04219 family outer membrane beta-barrel protein [Marinobacter adhaerens]